MENTIQSDLIRGHINTIILKALSDGDRYGYDIVREIEQKSSGQYKLKQPTLYSCLKRLEIQGFIRSYWGAKSNGGRRKYFTLTEMGRELFIKNQSEWEYSRTVIDKLISDREVDLNTYNSYDAQSASDEDFSEDEEDTEPSPTLDEVVISNEEESLETETDEEAELLDENENDDNEEEEVNDSDESEEVDSENNIDSDEEELDLNNEENFAADETSEQEEPYEDVSDAMSELLRAQNEGSGASSYTDRLTSEEFVSDSTDKYISSDDYFNDYFDANEQTTEESHDNGDAETSDSQTDDKEEPAENQPQAPEFLDYHGNYDIPTRSSSEIFESEYRNILGEFLSDSFISRQVEPPQPTTADVERPREPAPASATEPSVTVSEPVPPPIETYTSDAEVDRKLRYIAGEVRDMGTDVKIRTHRSESSKEYNNAYYYYSNKLLLTHYGILFGIMMAEILFTAVLINVLIGKGQASVWYYIAAVVIALAFPVFAFVKNMRNTDKRKRINFNLKNQLIYRFIVLAQCLLIIYCANVIGGMSVGFGIEYLTTLLLPALMCLNIPVSALIFNALYKSGKYSVKD